MRPGGGRSKPQASTRPRGGPGAARAAEAARARGLFTIVGRSRPGRARLRASPTGGRSSRPRTSAASSGSRRPSGSTASSRRASTGRSGSPPGSRQGSASLTRSSRDGGASPSRRRGSASGSTRQGVPQPRWRLVTTPRNRGLRSAVRRQGTRPAGSARAQCRSRRARAADRRSRRPWRPPQRRGGRRGAGRRPRGDRERVLRRRRASSR